MSKKSIQDWLEEFFEENCSRVENEIRATKSHIENCTEQIHQYEKKLINEGDPASRKRYKENSNDLQESRKQHEEKLTSLQNKLISLVEKHTEQEKSEIAQLKAILPHGLPIVVQTEVEHAIEEREQHIDEHQKQSELLQQRWGTLFQQKLVEENQPERQNIFNSDVQVGDQSITRTDYLPEQIIDRSAQEDKTRSKSPETVPNVEEPSSSSQFPQALVRIVRKQWISIVLVTVVFGAVPLARAVWAFREKQISRSQCNHELEIIGNTEKDWKTVNSILTGCKRTQELSPNDIGIQINAGRASLLRWHDDLSQTDKQRVVNQTQAFFDEAVFIAIQENSPRLGQALFYQGIIQDFERFIIREDYTCLEAYGAGETYESALKFYQRGDYKISKEDYFPILELAHFLMHRDQNYRTAQVLLEKAVATAPNDQAGEDERQLYRALLLNKAKAETHLDQFTLAKASLEKALEYEPNSYKIKLDLAAVSSHIAVEGPAAGDQVRFDNLQDAIKYYEEITSTKATDNIYQAWRNLSFLYYLRQDSKAIQSFKETTESTRFDSAAALDADAANKDDFELSNKDFVLFYRGLAQKKCFTPGECPDVNGSPEKLRAELRDRGFFDDYFITHNVIEDEFSDPFIDLEHDSFYKCNQV